MSSLVFHLLDLQSRDQFIYEETEVGRKVGYDAAGAEEDNSDEEFQTRGRGSGGSVRSAAGRRNNGKTARREYVVHFFGKTADGRAVRVDAVGFRPTFYIALPNSCTTAKASAEAIELIQNYLRQNGVDVENCTFDRVEKESFFGFSARMKRPFVEISFASQAQWREVRGMFLNDKMCPAISKPLGGVFGREAPEVFEANIDPMLRFLHVQNLAPCGWVQIEDGMDAADEEEGVLTLSCDSSLVEPCLSPPRASAPFCIASWDIECYSATGEFPIAKKDGAWGNLQKALEKVAGRPVEMRETVERLIEAGVFTVKGARAGLDRALASIGARGSATTAEVEHDIRGWLEPHGDPVIQIGVVLTTDYKKVDRHLFVWPECDKWDGASVHCFANEKAMIVGFFKWLAQINPDILLGYNVFGFDEKYLWERGQELGCLGEGTAVHKLNRLIGSGGGGAGKGGGVKLEEKFLSSSAMGDNYLYMWSTQGRLQIDLYHYIRRNAVLPSYKLDEVTKNYMSGKLKKVTASEDGKRLNLSAAGAVKDVRIGRAICLLDGVGESLTEKMVVEEVDVGGGKIVVRFDGDVEELSELTDAQKWVVVKDDVSPQDIFRLHRGSATDRAVIGRYCLQDCDLVLELYKKLETFNNAMSMANVCSVPINYIFVRGQGIKAESLIFKVCRSRGILIPVLPAPRQPGAVGEDGQVIMEDSYEGAIVLDPEPGFYCRSPIGVADFASLYPSTIESENISHDSLVWVKDYTYDGKLICVQFGSDRWAEEEGYEYTDIEFDIWRPDPADKRKHPVKVKSGRRICRYAQPLDGTKSTLPEIIRSLLAARKAKRKEAERETDPERKALLDAEQLAYKLTGNSLYGQLGSGTFKIRLQHLAASVTAYGRKQIMTAKAIIERFYGGGDRVLKVCDGQRTVRCTAKIMYGDTDSLFVEFNPVCAETGAPLEGREARQAVIDLTAEAGKMVTKILKPPHDFEFDKIFDPMLMFSKKRYAGLMFEENADDFVYKYMGIALKRRDNAPIVKTIFGAAMKKLLLEKDVVGATALVKEMTANLVSGKVSLGQLTITKSLRADYADPSRIAHKALADRITARDPGNAPASGDRIGFVYIKPVVGQLEAKLQGDRIETPAFVREKGLIPDYKFYIEHQLQNPISQMFGIVLEQMPGIDSGTLAHCPSDRDKAITWRENVAAGLLFGDALGQCSAADKASFFTKYFGGAKKLVAADEVRGATMKKSPASAPRTRSTAQQQPLSNYVLDSFLIDNMKKEAAAAGSAAGSGKKPRKKVI